jgi:Ca2+-binding RTX toxin-like protein
MTNFVWFGASGRFGATTDLGTATNWTSTNALPSVPTVSDSLIFNSRPGILTGTVHGLNADFSGVGTWSLLGAQLTLAGPLTVDGALSTTGASVTAASVAVNAGATLSGSGTATGTITDNGTIEASGGLLTLSGTVGGTGLLQIDVGATLDVNSASAGETISFLGDTGTLVDHQVGTIGAAISGFVAGDTIDLRSLTFAAGAAATIAGGVLTVTSGATSETLHLTGIGNATTFGVTADAGGIGTDITIGAAAPPPVSTPPTAAPPPPTSTPPTVAPPPPSDTPPAAIAAFDTTTNQPVAVVGQAYIGPVAGLQNEYINITSDSLSIATSTPNWFIHSGSGDDAIAVSSGINVLDGGTGSNFLTGGSGTDTFFVDDRGSTADIWSTVVGFHAGDAATIWGVTPQDFGLAWVDGQGAAGFTGLTLHATASGRPTASLTLAGYSQADLGNGRLSVSFGTDPASGSAYMFVHGNS